MLGSSAARSRPPIPRRPGSTASHGTRSCSSRRASRGARSPAGLELVLGQMIDVDLTGGDSAREHPAVQLQGLGPHWGAKLDGAHAKNAVFVEAKLERASFRGATLSQAIFQSAKASGAICRGPSSTRRTGRRPSASEPCFGTRSSRTRTSSYADIRNADFSGAGLFEGARYHSVSDDGAIFTNRHGGARRRRRARQGRTIPLKY